MLTASADHTARVWEAATGKAVGEPLQHNSDVWHAAFGPDGKWVVTASNDYTARVWEAPLEEPLSEQLINVVKLLPASIGHLDFDANGFLKPVSNSRVTECRDQISIALKQPGIRGSFLATRIAWFLADQRTRSINPTSGWTVPSFHAFDNQLASERAPGMLATLLRCRGKRHWKRPMSWIPHFH